MDGITTKAVAVAGEQPIILSGQVWTLRAGGPWPREEAARVTVLAVRDGWVRYDYGPDYASGMLRDERMRVTEFLSCYTPLDDLAERAEEEKLRDRFETWAHNHGWVLTRDKSSGIYHDNVTQYGWGAFCAGARGLAS